MPTVTLNKTVFEKLVGKKLSLAELKDRIAMLGTDLEKIEGNKIHVEIFPNRPDLLSEQGLARALSSFIGKKTGLREYPVKKGKEKVIVAPALKKIRPYTACAIVRGLAFDDEKIREIIQIQEKMHMTFCRNRKKSAIGIYPLENISFPVRFMAVSPENIQFQPLEARREMTAKQILSEHSKGKEFADLMKGLKKYAVFVDAKDKILSLTPIINSEFVGRVTKKTKEVFVEFSGFDLDHLKTGLNMFCAALADMGGTIESMEVLYGKKKIRTPDFSQKKMKLDLPYINKRLGLTLSIAEAKKLLARMGHGWKNGSVLVPAYRADILHQVDLAEDIAVAYGYENFKETIPNVATIGWQTRLELLKKKAAEILSGLGMYEVNTYHLIDKPIQTEAMCRAAYPVEILDPVSLEYNTLRETLWASLLEVLQKNRNRELPHSIFDSGIVFFSDNKKETGISEHCELGSLTAHHQADYTQALQQADYLLRMLEVKYKAKAKDHPSCIPGRAAEIVVGKQAIGMMGELHPQVLANLGLETPVVGFTLNLTELQKIILKNNLK